MATFFVELELDEKWLKALLNFTTDVYDGEVCSWLRIEDGN